MFCFVTITKKKIPPMKNQNTNWIRSFTNCYLSGGINFCTISPLIFARAHRAVWQSDFLPPTVLSHHSVIVNKIWCFCCYSYSCSLWLGGHYKERHWETHTHQIKVLLNSKQESPLFLVNFIQYCSICVALSGFFHHSVLLSLQSRFSKTYIL